MMNAALCRSITSHRKTGDLRALRSTARRRGHTRLADFIGYEIDMREAALGHLESVDFSGWGF